MKVTVHTDRCMGHAMCNVIAPDVYEVDDGGFNIIGTAEIDPGLEGQARQGAEACPERAIEIIAE